MIVDRVITRWEISLLLLLEKRDVDQAPYNCPDVGEQSKSCLYALKDNKEANLDEGAGKL